MYQLAGFIFLLFFSTATVQAQEESFVVRNLQATNQVLSNYVYGIEIRFELVYKSKKALIKDSEMALQLVENNHPVGSHALGETYRDPSNHLRVVTDLPRGKEAVISVHSLFIPYYAISLPPGEHTLTVQPVVKKALQDQTRQIALSYEGQSTVVLEQPELVKVQIKVTNVEAESSNLDGKSWDENLGIGKDEAKLPDLKWRLLFETTTDKDEAFTSVEVENSLKAAWSEPSPVFYMAPEDKVAFEVLDADGIGQENRIGKRFFTLTELQETTDTALALSFDRVRGLSLQLLAN